MIADAELLEAWRGGDKRAGKLLFERHYDAVHRFFRNKVGSDAPDLVQKTFLGCLESVERYRGEGSFRSWLFAVAFRQLCKHYRAKASERARFDVATVSICDFDPTPSRMLAERREQRLLLEALRRIPLDYQLVLELYYWEDMAAPELAQVLAIPEGTVRSRLRRAKEALADKMSSLARTPELLRATFSDLDGWVRSLRAQLSGE